MSRLEFACALQYPSGFRLDVAFEAGDGVTALFGPSGSGKSTALGLIAGLVQPQSGSIRLSGQVLVDTATHVNLPPERRQVGIVFQDHRLFPHLTVLRNLTFGQRRPPVRRIDFRRVVEILELGDLLARYPATLSGGQRQRVSLGRALLRGPELLLMDEPLTALDEGLKGRILTYLERAVAEWHLPTLFVSHDQADVRRLADNVVVLENGQVVDVGPTGATLDRVMRTHPEQTPSLVNLLRVDDVAYVEGHWQGRVGGQPFSLPAGEEGKTAQVLVRFWPHDVTLARSLVDGLSVRNQLRGRVRELVELADRVLVAIDVGQFLWAEVTPEAVRELGLQAGQEVACLVKARAVQRVS